MDMPIELHSFVPEALNEHLLCASAGDPDLALRGP